MKISVVTVAYNAESTISHTVESFVRQTHANREMILVDGASSDKTLDVVRSFNCEKIRIFSERDKGIYDAMNKGLRLFSGEAVGFLNADDTFHGPDALAAIAHGLEDADIVYGDQLLVADHNQKQVKRIWKTGPFGKSGFRYGWAPPHPTFYVRSAVAQSLREFETKYTIAGDYDFIIRAMNLPGVRAKYVERFLIDYQLGGTSSNGWKATYTGNKECLEVRRERLGHGPVDIALFLRLWRRLIQLRNRPMRHFDHENFNPGGQ